MYLLLYARWLGSRGMITEMAIKNVHKKIKTTGPNWVNYGTKRQVYCIVQKISKKPDQKSRNNQYTYIHEKKLLFEVGLKEEWQKRTTNKPGYTQKNEGT